MTQAVEAARTKILSLTKDVPWFPQLQPWLQTLDAQAVVDYVRKAGPLPDDATAGAAEQLMAWLRANATDTAVPARTLLSEAQIMVEFMLDRRTRDECASVVMDTIRLLKTTTCETPG